MEMPIVDKISQMLTQSFSIDNKTAQKLDGNLANVVLILILTFISQLG